MKRIFTILSVFIVLSGIISSCIRIEDRIKGRGRSIEVFTNINVNRVTEIITDGSIDVEVVPSNYYEVSITAQENIIDLIWVKVSGNVAKVSFRSGAHVIPTDVTKVTFFIPEVRSVITNGSGDIYCYDGFFSNYDMYIRTNGSGNINLSGMDCDYFETVINGSGDIRLSDIICGGFSGSVRGSGSIIVDGLLGAEVNTAINGSGDVIYRGSVRSHYIKVDGSGRVDAYDLRTENVNVNVFGSGNTYVWANRNLDVSIRGSGNVYYRGYPFITFFNSGSGKLIPY